MKLILHYFSLMASFYCILEMNEPTSLCISLNINDPGISSQMISKHLGGKRY